MRVHHISLLRITIGRAICTIGILGHLGLLKIGPFSIHIPVAMRMIVLHTWILRNVVTKILRVSMLYLYLQCT